MNIRNESMRRFPRTSLENVRHKKRYFVPQMDDPQIVIKLDHGCFKINYYWLQDYATQIERRKIINLAIKCGGWTMEDTL